MEKPGQIPTSEYKAVSPEMMEKPGQIPTSESKAVSPDMMEKPGQIPASECKAVSPEMMEKPGQIPTSEPKAVDPEMMECALADDLPKEHTGEQKGSANGKEVTPPQNEAGDDLTGPSAPKPDSSKESPAEEGPAKSEPEGELRAMTPEETALAQIAKLEDGVMKSALLSIVEAQLAKAGAQSS